MNNSLIVKKKLSHKSVHVLQRFSSGSEQNDVLTDAQFGFRPGYGTIDAIFVLNSIISQTLCKKKRLYCAFVDFKTAFDSINRFKLWLKSSNKVLKANFYKFYIVCIVTLNLVSQ